MGINLRGFGVGFFLRPTIHWYSAGDRGDRGEPLGAGLFGWQASGFVHQFVFECAAVGIEGSAFEMQPAACPAPGRYGGEDLAKDAFRGGGLDPKARGHGQRSRNAGFFVFLADGRLARPDAVYLGHGI